MVVNSSLNVKLLVREALRIVRTRFCSVLSLIEGLGSVVNAALDRLVCRLPCWVRWVWVVKILARGCLVAERHVPEEIALSRCPLHRICNYLRGLNARWSCQGLGLIRVLQKPTNVEIGSDTDLDLAQRRLVRFQGGRRLDRLPVDVRFADNIEETGQPGLSSALDKGLQWHERDSDQMRTLLHIQVVARSNGLVEHLELQITAIFEPFSVEIVEGHGKVLGPEVPGRVGTLLDVVRLDELPPLLALECGLHGDEGAGRFVLTQGILQPHSVVYLEVEDHILGSLVFAFVVENPFVNQRAGVVVALVELHELGELSEKDDVVNVARLQTVRNEIHIK